MSIYDLPGWGVPPRVRQIPDKPGSWGAVDIAITRAVCFDDDGYLWADGDKPLTFRDDLDDPPGWAVLYWTKSGLGLWLTRPNRQYIEGRPSPDPRNDRWIPIREIAPERPAFTCVDYADDDLMDQQSSGEQPTT